MKTLLAFGIWLVVQVGVSPHLVAADNPQKVTVKLGKIPEIRLGQQPDVDEAKIKRIKGLIADLAKLDSPDFGLSATLSGTDFAPIPGQSKMSMFLLTDHEVKRSQAFRDLVALGPVALPFLLDALDDKTPTKIVIKHTGVFGGMWYDSEMDLNPVNPGESEVFTARAEKEKQPNNERRRLDDNKMLTSHTVTIGDVCFVIIGQIVGRSYSAVRYQPTACNVINSTTHDAKFCAEVRLAWGSRTPVKKLFDSLLADYATEGIFNGKSLDGWYDGNEFQCRAVTRLLYYFPEESAKLIAGRLEKLDVGPAPEDFILQWVANGVRADDFIKAVAWCQNADVRTAVKGVFKRAVTRDVLLAALPAIEDVKLIRERLEPMVDRLPAEEQGPYGDGYHYLMALAERTPDSAKAVFQKYIKDGGLQRSRTVCLVFREVKVPWDVDLLGPLLTDQRKGYQNFAVEPTNNKWVMSSRICDDAAEALAMQHPELKFKLAGQYKDLDKQISVIREQLSRKK